MQQRIDQRPAPIPRRGMDHDAGWFIQDQKGIILEKDLERNGLSFHGKWFRLRDIHANPVPRLDLVARLHDLAIDPYST